VAYLQKAIENAALPDDAHYRLAQVYRRMGETEKAQQEMGLYKLASEKKNQQVEQERHELQQFVYTLREQGAAAPKESPPKKPPTHRNSSGSAVEVKMCRVR
jgi:hypothetical protein